MIVVVIFEIILFIYLCGAAGEAKLVWCFRVSEIKRGALTYCAFDSFSGGGGSQMPSNGPE